MKTFISVIALLTIFAAAASAAPLQPRQLSPNQRPVKMNPNAIIQPAIVQPGQRVYNLTPADIQEGQLWTLSINGVDGTTGSVQVTHPWNMLPVKKNGDNTPDGKPYPKDKIQYQFALRAYTPGSAYGTPPPAPVVSPDHHLLPIGKPGQVIIDVNWQGAPLSVMLLNWNTGRIIAPVSSTAGLN